MVAHMPGLRLLLRVSPLLIGAVAAVVWLRSRRALRSSLPAPSPAPRLDPPRESSGRFARPCEGTAEAQSEPRSDRIDIVTVVDDLLDIGRWES